MKKTIRYKLYNFYNIDKKNVITWKELQKFQEKHLKQTLKLN